MAYQVELVENGQYVRLTLMGGLTRSDHDEFRAKALAALAETGWAKVLIDTTEAEPEMSVFDDFEYTSGHQAKLPPKLSTAIVHRADETARYEFIEDVAINRGVNIRTFPDESEALSWLIDG